MKVSRVVELADLRRSPDSVIDDVLIVGQPIAIRHGSRVVAVLSLARGKGPPKMGIAGPDWQEVEIVEADPRPRDRRSDEANAGSDQKPGEWAERLDWEKAQRDIPRAIYC